MTKNDAMRFDRLYRTLRGKNYTNENMIELHSQRIEKGKERRGEERMYAHLFKHFISCSSAHSILRPQEPLTHEAISSHNCVFWTRVVLDTHLQENKVFMVEKR